MTAGIARRRIGIDAHVLGKNIGGVERYVSKVVELVPERLPQHDFVIFLTQQAKTVAGPSLLRSNVALVALPVSDPIVQRSVFLPWAIRRHRLDILQVQRIAPWACGRCKIMLTVHDLTPIIYAAEYPGLRNRLVRHLTPSSLRRADLIACPTRTICDQIGTLYPGVAAPRHPFYLGADHDHFAPVQADVRDDMLRRLGITRPFIYSPGAIEARKNIEVVLAALARLDPLERPDLLLSGPVRDKAYLGRLLRQAADLGIAGAVRHLGFVAEQDLSTLYGCAKLCVSASIDEGFNLMPVEALSCGTPVVCSDIPVHRELYSGCVAFFSPRSVDQLAVLLNGRIFPADRNAIAACLERLRWTSMAERMAALFQGMTLR